MNSRAGSPVDDKMAKHGGRRAGAGRPKTVDAPVRRTVYLAQRHVDLINCYQKPGATFSEALRTLLDASTLRALKATSTVAAGTPPTGARATMPASRNGTAGEASVTPKLVHLLAGVAAQCGSDNAVYVTSNPDSVTCADCLTVITGEPPEEPVPEKPRPVDVEHPIRTPGDLRTWRTRNGSISLRKLAGVLGVHWMTLHKWERGGLPVPRAIELALNYLEGRATV